MCNNTLNNDDTVIEIQTPIDLKQAVMDLLGEELYGQMMSLFELQFNKKRVKSGGRTKTFLTPEDEVAHYKQYFRTYYDKHKHEEFVCPTCRHDFTCKSSLNKHLNKASKCKIKRLELELEQHTKQAKPELN